MTKHLDEFCRAVLADPKPYWFIPETGLCCNYWLFLVSLRRYTEQEIATFENRLRDLLSSEYGHRYLPFNSSTDDYWKESDTLTVYNNPKRLAFLRKWSKANEISA